VRRSARRPHVLLVFDNKTPFKLRHKTKTTYASQSHPFSLSLPHSFIFPFCSTSRLALSNNAYRHQAPFFYFFLCYSHLLHLFPIAGTSEVAVTRSGAHVYKTALPLVEKGAIASMLCTQVRRVCQSLSLVISTSHIFSPSSHQGGHLNLVASTFATVGNNLKYSHE
jgi:hypothetical protein